MESNALNNGCVFCAAMTPAPQPLYNTTLVESKSFVVLPALGPLIAGHVLVVSRAHYWNLASLDPRVVAEYDELVRLVRARYGVEQAALLEAEHGMTPDDYAGGCIDHLHVNLMPGLGHLVDVLDGVLPSAGERPDTTSLSGIDFPYVFLRAGGAVKLYRASGAPSQLIRRAIAERFHREDWDWAVFPNESVIEQTVAIWKAA